MEEHIQKIVKKNISDLRETATKLIEGTLTTQELLDITQEFKEEIAELIKKLANSNEKLLNQMIKKDTSKY